MADRVRNRLGPRRQAVPSRINLSSFLADVLAVTLGLTSTVLLHIVGELPAAEAILLASIPFLLITQGRRLSRPGVTPIFALMALWLLGQVLTDIYRQTAMVDWMRGDAAILFFAIDLAGLIILLGHNERRQVLFVMAYAIGSLLVTRFHPPAFAVGAPWKFGYSTGTIMLVVLASCYFYRLRRFGMVLVLLIGIAAVNLLLNYRSPVLGLLITIVLVVPVIPERVGRLQLLPRAGTFARTAILVALALGAAGTAAGLVVLVTRSGLLGQQAQKKNEEQSQSIGGMLLGGRPEILVSARAVMDSPILGHGSWAKNYKYVEMLNDIETRYGITESLQQEEESGEGVIPAHSHLMGAWVWAGILGAIFWVYILRLTVLAIIGVSNFRPMLAPIYAWLLVDLAWAIFFSPFGSVMRIYDAFIIVIALDLLEMRSVGELGQAPHVRRARYLMPRTFA